LIRSPLSRRQVTAGMDRGTITADAGGLLWREFEVALERPPPATCKNHPRYEKCEQPFCPSLGFGFIPSATGS